MKDNCFGYIISFTLGAIIFSFISVAATGAIGAGEVLYDNSESGLTSKNMQGAINELYDKAKYGDAIAGNILSGKTALIGGSKITGTMANNGATGGTINPGGSYTIPAGYTSGGKVTANANQNSGTYTFASGSNGSTVDMGVNNTYRYVNASNVYNKGVADADNRANTSSTNYKSGYNAGWAAKKSRVISGKIANNNYSMTDEYATYIPIPTEGEFNNLLLSDVVNLNSWSIMTPSGTRIGATNRTTIPASEIKSYNYVVISVVTKPNIENSSIVWSFN